VSNVSDYSNAFDKGLYSRVSDKKKDGYTMQTFNDINVILDELKSRYDIESDYKLSQKLNVSRSRVSSWRNGTATVQDDVAATIDNLLKLPTGVTSLEMHAKRSNCPAISDTFHELAKKLAAGALCVCLCFGSFFPNPANANVNQSVKMSDLTIIYIMRITNQIRRRRRTWLNHIIRSSYILLLKTPLNYMFYINDKTQIKQRIIIKI